MVKGYTIKDITDTAIQHSEYRDRDGFRQALIGVDRHLREYGLEGEVAYTLDSIGTILAEYLNIRPYRLDMRKVIIDLLKILNEQEHFREVLLTIGD